MEQLLKMIQLNKQQNNKHEQYIQLQPMNNKASIQQTRPSSIALRLLNSSYKQQSSKPSSSTPFFYISSQSPIILFYNLIFIFIFYMTQIQISLQIAFGPQFLSNQLAIFGYTFVYWVGIAFYVFDVVLNFNKGYYQHGKGRIIQQQTLIIKHYIKNQIYFDLINIALLIIPQINQNFNLNFIQIIPMILLWIKKYKYQNQIITLLQYQRIIRIIFMLIVLFIDILLLGHYGACIFVSIDINLWNTQYFGSNTNLYWLSNNSSYSVDLMGGIWWSFSTGTLSTLAPGPFGKNPVEVSFAIVIMIFFMLLASYVGEVLINILYTQQQKRIFHEQNIQDFDKYMVLKQIPDYLKTRIYNFFQLIWQVQSKMQTSQQKKVIQTLPTSLKQQLLLQMSFINTLYFIRYFNNEKFIQRQLALKIDSVIIDADSYICKEVKLRNNKEEGNVKMNQNKYMYYLAQGFVRFVINLNVNSNGKGNIHGNKNINVKNNSNETNIHGNSYVYESQLNSQKQQTKPNHQQQQFTQQILSLSNISKQLGIFQFITNQSYQISYKTIDLCQLDRISRYDFLNILQLSQNKNIELFHKLRNELLHQRQLNLINKHCSICYEQHLDHLCPQINYHEKVYNMLKQVNFSINQNRLTQFNRDKINGFKTYQLSKVNNDQIPFINMNKKLKHLNKKSSLISSFSAQSNPLLHHLLIKNIINLHESMSSTLNKTVDIEDVKNWKKYYPQYNIKKTVK